MPSVKGIARARRRDVRFHEDEHDAHPDTRTDLLNEIRDWAHNPRGMHILAEWNGWHWQIYCLSDTSQAFAKTKELGASFSSNEERETVAKPHGSLPL